MLLGRITLYLLLTFAIISALVIASRDVYVPLLSTVFESVTERELESVSANAWGLFDPETGIVLDGKDINAIHSIASITKLFTAHAAYHSDFLETDTWITWRDLNTEGRAGKLRHGSQLSVHELLFPLLIESSNDAGSAIGRVLGSTFVVMNGELGTELALEKTHIEDPTGLSAQNVSTVRELARIYAHIRRDSAHLLDITRLSLHINGSYGWRNNNPAQADVRFRGGKHGVTPEAGRTLLAQFDIEPSKEERHIGVVLLGSENIPEDLDILLRYASRAY